MFIKHPNGKELINLDRFDRIRKDENGQFLNFFSAFDIENGTDLEDGTDAAFRIKFSTVEKRDAWFDKLTVRTNAGSPTVANIAGSGDVNCCSETRVPIARRVC